MAKSKPINVLLGILTLVVVLAIAPSAFADSTEVDVAKGAGASANADCVSANNCFNPNPVTVAPGTDVEWKNTDTVGHTVTSGKPTDNDAGSLFDSSIIKAGGEFKFTFQNPGTFDYFCQVHPWMTGQVIVSASASTTSSSSTMSGNMPMSSSTPSTTSNAPATASVTMNDNMTTAATTSASNPAGQGQQGGIPLGSPYGNQSAPTTSTQQPLSNPAGEGQQGGVPLGSSYGSNAVPAPATPDASAMGWVTGIVVIAIMSGVGIWSAVRRR